MPRNTYFTDGFPDHINPETGGGSYNPGHVGAGSSNGLTGADSSGKDSPDNTGGGAGADWIAAAINFGQAIYNANRMKASQERQNQYNREMADYQYDLNMKAWREMNAYNTPAAQMGRYMDAGLNPNMIYGQGGSAGNANGVPSYDRPEGVAVGGNPINFSSALDAYQDYRLRTAQIEQIQAHTELTKQEAINKALTAEQIPAKTTAINTGTELTSEKLDQLQGLRNYNFAIKENDYRKSQIEVDQFAQRLVNMRQENAMQLLQQDSMKKNLTLQELQMESQRAEIVFKQMENQWRKAGVTSSDNPLLRIFVRKMGDAGLNPVFNLGTNVWKPGYFKKR